MPPTWGSRSSRSAVASGYQRPLTDRGQYQKGSDVWTQDTRSFAGGTMQLQGTSWVAGHFPRGSSTTETPCYRLPPCSARPLVFSTDPRNRFVAREPQLRLYEYNWGEGPRNLRPSLCPSAQCQRPGRVYYLTRRRNRFNQPASLLTGVLR